MDETIFYISDVDSVIQEKKENFAFFKSLHTTKQFCVFKNVYCLKNGAYLTGVGFGEKLIVSCKGKGLLNVYSWGKEGIDQKIPVPEVMTSITGCKHYFDEKKEINKYQGKSKNSRLSKTWLIACGSVSGKIYIWEYSSGNLICVQEAHYQRINILKFSKCGTYLVSSGPDGRCLIWSTLDLVSIYKNMNKNEKKTVKPIYAIFDNTGEVSDVLISNSGLINDMRVYTASRDRSLRVYDINTKNTMGVFVFPVSIESLAIDPCGREIYVGLSNGLISALPLYRTNLVTKKLESSFSDNNIITNVDILDPFFVFQSHKNIDSSDNDVKITKLCLSIDGTLLISGDSLGRIFVSETSTKQIIRSFNHMVGEISHIELLLDSTECFTKKNATFNNNFKNEKNCALVPIFKRALTDLDPLNHILYSTITLNNKPEEYSKENFSSWFERLKKEELNFDKNLNNNEVVVKSEELELNKKYHILQDSFLNLKEKYDSLLKEHSQLLTNF